MGWGIGKIDVIAENGHRKVRRRAVVGICGALFEYARDGDVIVVHTLDRAALRDTLNLVDPIRIDSSNPEDPMAQLSVVLLVLFRQLEGTYTLGWAAAPRAVATARGR